MLTGQALKDAKEYSLSSLDIQKALGGTKIYTYPQLQKYTNINDLFDNKGRFVLLYLTENKYTGHWACCFKNGNKIYWFDSYGLKPSEPLNKWLTKEENNILNQKYDFLNNLLLKASREGYEIYYNPYRFQSYAKNNNECGRWVVLRLLNRNLDNEQFKEYIDNKKVSPDDYATKTTFEIIGKGKY